MPDLDRPALEAACRRLGLSLAEEQLGRLERYAELLRDWNRRFNLISRADTERILSYHILDSLAVSRFVAADSRTADVGTGAGLPGIPLAIARPDLETVLVESSHKKCLFLDTCRQELALANVRIAEGRSESLAPLDCGVILSRLTGPLRLVLKQTRQHLVARGRLILFKTTDSDGELRREAKAIARYGFSVERTSDVSLPVSGIRRRFVILSRG